MRKFFIILMALAVTACSKEMSLGVPEDFVVDWQPVTLSIIASDTAGNDIISPSLSDVSITYLGKTYRLQKSRAYNASIQGLFVQKFQMTDILGHLHEYRILFGEIDGALDMDEDLILTWDDGTKYTIHYHCSEHIYGPAPQCTRKWTLNGVETELPILIIK